MNTLMWLAFLLQPTTGTGATHAEGGTPPAAGGDGAAALPTPGQPLAPAEATEETARRFSSFEGFFKADNLVYLWETYGIPALKALVILVLAWIIAGWIKRILTTALQKAKVEVTLAKFLANIARWAILLLAGMSVLDTLGIRTTSFAAVIAAMGFAVGLALSGSLGNLAAGVMLLLFRPFKVGDVITTGGVNGVVDEIELFSTTLVTSDNRKFIMPNGSVFNTTIENQTANPKRVVSIGVTIAGDSDVERARALFTEAAKGVEGRSPEDAPVVALTDLAGVTQVWAVGVWAPTGAFLAVKERLLIACKRAVDENSLGVPMPQQIVNIKQIAG